MSHAAAPLHERRVHAAARDAALARLTRVKRLVVVLTLALAAGFAVLAQGATPPAQKQRHAVVLADASRPAKAQARPHHVRRHHHHRRHRSSQASSAAATATSSSAPAAPSTPSPAQSQSQAQAPAAQPQAPAAPAAPPAATQQQPAATSGGS
jgi:hypothetical protein